MKNVNHALRYPREKYDYIETPKFTGYRGIHDVYRHLPRGSDRAETRKPWDGLMVEINTAHAPSTLGPQQLKSRT
jgi:hypothetical protein